MHTNLPSLWQLRVFEAVARIESVSGASREVLRSQPAVTASILRLEKALDATLFDRAATGIYLSSAGVSMLVRSRDILAAAEQAIVEVGGRADITPLATAVAITKAQMRAIAAINEAGSFHGAASRLKVSSASVQRLARELERHVGVPLFRHTASGVATTDAGAQLARRLSIVSQRIKSLASEIDRRKVPQENCVNVGVQLLDPNLLLSNAILEFGAALGEVKVRVISDRLPSLFQKLRTRTVDFILGALSGADYGVDIVEEPICSEDYCVVARSGHALAGVPAMTVEQLRQYKWILPPQGSRRHIAFEHIFIGGHAPTAVIETHSLSAIRTLLAESDMMTVLSRFEAIGEQKTDRLPCLIFVFRGRAGLSGS